MRGSDAADRPDNLGDVIRAHAGLRPDFIAFEFEGVETSYSAFDRQANQIAHALMRDGVVAGDRVAYLGKNCTAYFALLIGAARIGAVLVPVNWRLAPPEIEQILKDSGAFLLFVGAEFAAAAKAATQTHSGIRKIVAIEGELADFEPMATFLAGQPDAPPAHVAKSDDPLVQLYTSGTTGLPKGVVLTHRALLQQRYDLQDAGVSWALWDEHDISLLAMPVFHISGTGWGNYGMFAGAKSVIVREFEPSKLLDLIEKEKVSRLFLVPAALKILLDDPRSGQIDYSCVRGINYGSSPIPEALLKRAIDLIGPIFVQHYGLTETTGTVVALDIEDHHPPGNPRLRSCGRAVAKTEVRIVDPDGNCVPPRIPGEIQIRSSSNMLHYWKQPEATAQTLTPDNWLRTGDAAWMDEEGYIFILDRIKDMIISGGENIYPVEVENAIFGHPLVEEVAVIGVPDDRWGEAVRAVIVLRPGAQADTQSIDQWARARIAGYKVPKSYVFVDSLPRNASGKILRREVRAAAWADQARQVN